MDIYDKFHANGMKCNCVDCIETSLSKSRDCRLTSLPSAVA